MKRYKDKQGRLHRLDGPAIEYSNGGKEWWQNGKLHRLDGPAVEWSDGTKIWYLNGKWVIEQEFKVVDTKLIKGLLK